MPIRIEVTTLDSGLLVATSPDLHGLIVHGRTLTELGEKMPQAIEALRNAEANSPRTSG